MNYYIHVLSHDFNVTPINEAVMLMMMFVVLFSHFFAAVIFKTCKSFKIHKFFSDTDLLYDAEKNVKISEACVYHKPYFRRLTKNPLTSTRGNRKSKNAHLQVLGLILQSVIHAVSVATVLYCESCILIFIYCTTGLITMILPRYISAFPCF